MTAVRSALKVFFGIFDRKNQLDRLGAVGRTIS
jgi:hypothetical protein